MNYQSLFDMNNRFNGFIKNMDEIKEKENKQYELYPTGNFTLTSGRIYVALSSSKPTQEEIKKYNIIK
jgi:hypothetical protein